MNKNIVTKPAKIVARGTKAAVKATGRGVLLVIDETEIGVRKVAEDTKWSWYNHQEHLKARTALRQNAKSAKAAAKAAAEEDADLNEIKTQLHVDEQSV